MMEWGRAICYSGYRENQSPLTCTYPTYEQIVEDLRIIESLDIKYIRMYDPISYAEMTCQVIRDLKLDIKLMLGPGLISEYNNPGCPWLQTSFTDEELKQRAEHNDRNIDELIRIANEYTDVINVVSIGNENTPEWGANNVPVDRLIGFAKRLKEGTNQLVTFCEGAPDWEKIPQIAEHMDIISMHTYPLWAGLTVEEAMDFTKMWYKKIKEKYPNKTVFITEAGWATSSADDTQMKENQTNEDNQARYYEELMAWSKEEKVIIYAFEAFDEPWKGGPNPDNAEKHWGIYNVDRTPKKYIKSL